MRHSPLLVLLLSGVCAAQTLESIPMKGRVARERHRALERRLDQTLVSIDWEDLELKEVVADVSRRTGINVFIAPKLRERDLEPVTLKARNVTAATLIRFLRDFHDVVFQNRYGLIVVTTKDEAQKRASVLRLYSIHGLLYVPPDFPGPRLDLRVSGMDVEAPEVAEQSSRDPEEIIDLIKMATGEKNWDSDWAHIDASRGTLIVRHTPAMQRKVTSFLYALGGL